MHISELADFRVKRTEDVAKIGDIIWVKCIGIDDKGRVKLSRKAAMKERAEAETGQVPAAPARLAAANSSTVMAAVTPGSLCQSSPIMMSVSAHMCSDLHESRTIRVERCISYG